MLRQLIRWRLNVEERKLGQSLDYLREMVRVSLRAFFRFAKIMPMATYRRTLSADAYYVAKLVSTRHEDCGPCLQIEINQAKRDGVPESILESVVACQPESLPEELVDVYRFTETVVISKTDDTACRERIRKHYGEQGLVELALAIASCRVFPTTKRALGYATSCSAVRVEI